MERRVISSDQAPAAIGPYSQAIAAGDLIFCSGQIPLDPASGQIVEGDAAVQARRVLENLTAVLEAAGSSLALVVKVTMFLANLEDFNAVNQIYGEYFPSDPPARSTFQVARLPRDAKVEIEAIALR
jgi:2-iminobutanoate/2-iminopropanoate deaminase